MPVKLENKDVKLKVTIANNSDFTESSYYETNFVDSGTNIEVNHLVTSTVDYYIRMEAKDKSGVKAGYIEYAITAIRTLYFLSKPSVKTQAPQANSVTVRSPTAEYTATTTPNVDELIERLVEIDEGDQATCKKVAKELISRWGREQKSVSGDINLTVTLEFKEKVHVIDLGSNIDEDMLLQKKGHDVTGRITTITVGDIILSDNELLARILDELT